MVEAEILWDVNLFYPPPPITLPFAPHLFYNLADGLLTIATDLLPAPLARLCAGGWANGAALGACYSCGIGAVTPCRSGGYN